MGGCCTLLPGALAGARGALGPSASSTSTATSTSTTAHLADRRGRRHADRRSCRATARGVGGAVVSRRSLRAGDSCILGTATARSSGRRAARGSPGPGVSTPTPRDRGAGAASARRARPVRPERAFWLHLDVDVLDRAVFPATDYLMPGGLDWDELTALCAAARIRGSSAGRSPATTRRRTRRARRPGDRRRGRGVVRAGRIVRSPHRLVRRGTGFVADGRLRRGDSR